MEIKIQDVINHGQDLLISTEFLAEAMVELCSEEPDLCRVKASIAKAQERNLRSLHEATHLGAVLAGGNPSTRSGGVNKPPQS